MRSWWALTILNAYVKYRIQGDFLNPDPALAIDIFNPTYGIDPAFFTNALATTVLPGENFSVFKDEFYGVYFQDHITLWDKLHIIGGGRYDWAEVGRGNSGSFDEADANLPAATRDDEEFSPRVGVLYQAWPWLGVYGSWSQSFSANNGVSATGETLEPQTGEQWETGLKTELFNKALSATLAFYHLTKENILTADLSTPDPNDNAPIGESRSQGIELDVLGAITDELSVIGSYAYTDAEITKDNFGLEGNRVANVPFHSGSAFLTYEFKEFDALRGLSLGFGVFAVGDREGDDDNTFLLPGYARLDAFAAYRRQVGPTRVTAQLNIRNITDKEYFESTDPFSNLNPRLGIFPGAPLTAIGTLRVEF